MCTHLEINVHRMVHTLNSTLEERAKRLFLTKGVPLGALDSSLFAKSKSSVQEAQRQKEIAMCEAMIYKYSELLGVRHASLQLWVGHACIQL